MLRLTTLLLLLAACSSPDAAPEKTPPITKNTRNPSRDAGTTPAPSEVTDAGIDAGGDDPLTHCPAAAPTTYPAYVSPPARGKPCTPGDLDFFLANETKSWDEQRAGMVARNPQCASCVYTKQSDTNWGPMTKLDDGRKFYSFGYCYKTAGASDACAHASQDYEFCQEKVCNVCLTGQSQQDCIVAVRTGACKTKLDPVVAACGDYNQQITVDCYGSGDVFATMCGGN